MRKPGMVGADGGEPRFTSATIALAGRPLVQRARQIFGRLRPSARRWAARSRRVADLLQRVAVLAAGQAARPLHAGRGRWLEQVVRGIPQPPAAPSVSVITLRSWPAELLPLVPDGSEVVIAAPDSSRVTALARAAESAINDVLCFVPDPTGAPDAGWVSRLAAGLGDDIAATTPTLVAKAAPSEPFAPDQLLIRSAGFEVAAEPGGGPTVRARAHGQRPDAGAGPFEVAGAPLRGLTVTRSAYAGAGGLVDTGDDDAAAVDLVTRLRARGERVRHLPAALVFDDRPPASIGSLSRPVDPRSPAWRQVVDRCGPALAHAVAGAASATTWAITTAVTSPRVAERWGDWHFAQALAGSLRRAGHPVVVQRLDQADDAAGRSCDVHLVLHGLASVRRTRGQRHILWVISHPETVTQEACEDADLVLVASERFAQHLRQRTATPVEVLLQATDHRRFRPVATQAEHRHDVTVVARTRDVRRAVVGDAIDAGLRPAIYGSGWRTLVDPALVVADHVDNRDLPAVYCSAGVVLNDHWEAMREWGFVSNRLFDVLACGVPVISDPVDGLGALFGDAVPVYETAADLRHLVERALDDPTAARDRARAGRAAVLAAHTFDHRASALLALADRYLCLHHPLPDHTTMGSQP